jgi:hypothetical protein
MPLDCEQIHSADKSAAVGGHDAANRIGHFKRPAAAAFIGASPAMNDIAPAGRETVVKKSA